jgi:hypothetical protein
VPRVVGEDLADRGEEQGEAADPDGGETPAQAERQGGQPGHAPEGAERDLRLLADAEVEHGVTGSGRAVLDGADERDRCEIEGRHGARAEQPASLDAGRDVAATADECRPADRRQGDHGGKQVIDPIDECGRWCVDDQCVRAGDAEEGEASQPGGVVCVAFTREADQRQPLQGPRRGECGPAERIGGQVGDRRQAEHGQRPRRRRPLARGQRCAGQRAGGQCRDREQRDEAARVGSQRVRRGCEYHTDQHESDVGPQPGLEWAQGGGSPAHAPGEHDADESPAERQDDPVGAQAEGHVGEQEADPDQQCPRPAREAGEGGCEPDPGVERRQGDEPEDRSRMAGAP